MRIVALLPRHPTTPLLRLKISITELSGSRHVFQSRLPYATRCSRSRPIYGPYLELSSSVKDSLLGMRGNLLLLYFERSALDSMR